MSERFIARKEAETDLLACAAYLAERITSIDGHAEAMMAVVPQYIAQGNVDLAAELANTVDDPFTRDRLLIAVAEKCAEMDDDEYALQLAEAVEEPGLKSQALERIGLQKAAKGEFEKAREIASGMTDPDLVLIGIAVRQASAGLNDEALETIEEIEHSSAAVTAFMELAAQQQDAERSVQYLELAVKEAAEIEHEEEQARAFCDIGNGFLEAGRNDLAIGAFDKARATAETIDNMHRDTFLSLAAQGFVHAGSVDLADRTLDLVADKTQIASALLGYARAFWKKDERAEAVEALDEAHAILESQHERETRDHKVKFRLFTAIASQFAGFEKGERAIEIAEKIPEDTERKSALSQVAAVLVLREQDELAREAAKAIDDSGDRAFALIGMSDAKEKNGDRAAAIELLDEAAELAVPQLTMRASACIEIGKRLLSYGESDGARTAFEQVMRAVTEIRDESARVAALSRVSEVEGDVDLSAKIPEVLTTVLSRGA